MALNEIKLILLGNTTLKQMKMKLASKMDISPEDFGIKYYDNWKHSDVRIDLYAQYGCVSSVCEITNHSWEYNGP